LQLFVVNKQKNSLNGFWLANSEFCDFSEPLKASEGHRTLARGTRPQNALPRVIPENKSPLNMNIASVKPRSLFVPAVFALFVSAVYMLAWQRMPAGPLPMVLAAAVVCSLGMRPALREEAHIAASVFCVLHAALVSYLLWHTIRPNTDNFSRELSFYTLAFAWPVWLVVLPILWSFTARKWWKLLVPLGLGTLALFPALPDLESVFSFLIHGPGL
jgi:hypothetical protein